MDRTDGMDDMDVMWAYEGVIGVLYFFLVDIGME
jgi:hypothetical protein